MTYLFIILYAITLIYFALSERVKKFVTLLSIQGAILFGVVFFSLIKIDIFDFIFILLETILVKSIIIPWFLNRVRKYNNLKRENEPYIPVFYSIIVVTVSLIVSFLLSHYLQISHNMQGNVIHTQYFTVAFASVIFGIYFIIVHKNIFSHVVGYLIIENGIFLLSLSVGSQMPMMVNLAILLDILMGVLVLGIFINHIGDTFSSVEAHRLSELKD
jgi:hydrogenase-4 component E